MDKSNEVERTPKKESDGQTEREQRVHESALLAHERQLQAITRSQQAALASSNVAMRAMLVVNGGAVIALLAFVGAIETGDTAASFDSAALVHPILSFAIGVGMATVTAGLAYLINGLDAEILSDVELKWEHPFVVEKETPLTRRRLVLYVMAVGLGVGSIVAFFVGVFGVTSALSQVSL